MRYAALALTACMPVQLLAQQAQPIDMQLVELNKPFAHKPVAQRSQQPSGLGFFTFDAPNSPSSTAPFTQYQVALTEDKATVYYVRATRPFTSLAECRQNADVLRKEVKRVPGHSVTKDEFARFEARRGDEAILVACTARSGSPYMDLEFMRRSSSVYEQIKTHRR
jgi:hypothetical protein